MSVKAGSGTVLVDDNPQSGSKSYDENKLLKIEAVPASGYLFDRWDGDLSGSKNPTEIKMTSKKTVEVYFISKAELEAQDPVAHAGSNQTCDEGETVTLDGSDSSDPLDRSLAYKWEQTDGSPAVELSGANKKTATFTAPDITGEKECLTFRLTVTDAEGDQNSDDVTICINTTNVAPEAVLDRVYQSVNGGEEVTIDGSASSDEDGSIASYQWQVWSGNQDIKNAIDPILAGETGASATFTAPNIDGYVEIQMTVTDDEGATASETMQLSISSVEGPVYTSKLYFPHVDSGGKWETEICLVNKSNSSVSGQIKLYTPKGNLVSQSSETLGAYGRKAWVVGEEFKDSDDIRYAIFESNSSSLCGYTKFYQEGLYRVAVPAVQETNKEAIYIPHIDSSSSWWTGLALVNTTNSTKTLTFTFSNGAVKKKDWAAGEHKSFTIAQLFKDTPQPDIESAVITGGAGVIGLELFSKGKTLSGVLLKDESADTLYFPHVDSDKWWTGIAAYNMNSADANLTVTPYTESGEVLPAITPESIPAGSKYIGDIPTLKLPDATAWFKVDASQPVNGFELFGTRNGNSLAGYSTVNIQRQNGVFPKLEHEGWTGIAFVNTTGTEATITLRIYDDGGEKLSQKDITLGGYAKLVDQPEDIFAGSITAGTYIKFMSDQNVVGFQLNGSDDGMMLDALPGM
ncbi:MAG: PKD domain-containing protein [Desulfobacterales bacterium]